ncbi:MAG: hypothetical protein KDA61_06540, partial [Planctomycetales bacterium]|nr:hypothetical protein [Planctomycetales bacterium]
EQNPFNGRLEELMAFDRALSAEEALQQFQLVSGQPGDRNRDGNVDGFDFLTIQRNPQHWLPGWEEAFGTSTFGRVASAPEPSALAMSLFTAAFLSERRLRRCRQRYNRG